MVREEFPSVRMMRRDQRAGLIVRRNESFRDARTKIVVSLDDDAFFTAPNTLKRIVELFELWPSAAALALPYVEPNARPDAVMMPASPFGASLKGFSGGVSALRRNVALEFGGFPELLVHQGEERDLCVRLIEKNWEIRYADTPPIVHLYSLQREAARINYYGYRNTVLFYWMRAPFPECLVSSMVATAKLLMYRFTFASLWSRITPLCAGWWGIVQYWSQRVPVSRTAWRRYRNLLGHGPFAISNQEREHFITLSEVLGRRETSSFMKGSGRV